MVIDLDNNGGGGGGISNLYAQVSGGWLQWRASESDSWQNLILASSLVSEAVTSVSASSVANNGITYSSLKTNFVNGDAGLDLTLKIDHTTIPDGGTMDFLFKANGADRVVSYSTIYTTKLGTSMTVASGDTAHYRIKRVGSVYNLYLIGIT